MFEHLPKKRYSTIVIDPPWPITMAGTRTISKHKRPRSLPYSACSVADIAAFPLAKLTSVGAHVYCWTTNRMLPETFQILDGWGVRFHLAMPLVKRSGIAPCNGYVFASEFCLMGFAGRPMLPFKGIGKLNWLETAPTRWTHSAKPEEFYRLLETMSPGPRIDLFARKKRDGWDCWGDELG